MSETVSLSVGQLVSMTCMSGDLVHDQAWGPSAVQGIRAHQRYQAKATKADDRVQSEVRLSHRFTRGDESVELNGRLDLVYPHADTPTLTEIKSTFTPPARIHEGARARHRAQLTVYASLYLAQPEHQSLAGVTGQLVWCNLLDQTDTVEEIALDRETADTFVAAAIDRYLAWHALVSARRAATRATSAELDFPWGDFRPGQRAFAAHVYRTARDGGQLLAEAPTGTGKTASTLYPAIKAIGSGHVSRAVYLTAKTTGRNSVSASLETMREAGLEISHLTLRAKQQVCPCSQEDFTLDPDGRCPRTVGFFDRLPAAREALMRDGVLDGDTVDAVATEHALCPFELALQLLPWVDVVVSDFNYVFDPLVRLTDLATPTRKSALLIDEAHNLGERSRSMYSAELDTQLCQRAERDARGDTELLRAIQPVRRALKRLARDHDTGDTVLDAPPDSIARAITRVFERAGDTLGATLWRGVHGELAREMMRYQAIEALYGPSHTTLLSVTPSGKSARVQLRLIALDAATDLSHSLKRYRATVAFSATLQPLEAATAQLGFGDDTVSFALPSPFDPGNLCCLIHTGIDPRYQRRAESIAPLVETIQAVYSAQRGNYWVFFPSYAYLDQVVAAFTAAHPDIPVCVQTPGSDADARAEFLAAFTTQSATLGFAILGGVFGEGVDLHGARLIGAILVGTGLPPPSTDRKLLEQHQDALGRNGRDTAFTVPAMTRVAQTAGRVIRSETDRGVLVLIDPRYAHPPWRTLMPPHWQPDKIANGDQLQARLDAFWGSPITP